MKAPRLAAAVACLCLFLSGGMVGTAMAQQPPSQPFPWEVTIEKIEVSKINYSETDGPRVYGMPVDRSSEWIRVTLEYELGLGDARRLPPGLAAAVQNKELWADSVELTWDVILPVEYRGTLSPRQSFRMQRVVTFGNVQADGKHYAVVYIDPRTFARYKDVLHRDMLFVQASIKIDGRTRAEAWARGRGFTADKQDFFKMFPEFRRTGPWFGAEELREMKGSLLTRMQTPWEWQSWGSYEHIIKD